MYAVILVILSFFKLNLVIEILQSIVNSKIMTLSLPVKKIIEKNQIHNEIHSDYKINIMYSYLCALQAYHSVPFLNKIVIFQNYNLKSYRLKY